MAAMKRLLDAPHRVFFFAAAVQLLIVSAWWAATLAARLQGLAFPVPEGVQAAHAHAFLMIYGFFPLFVFGFVFTAGPRWLGLAPLGRRQFAVPALVAGAAAWLLLPALYVGRGTAAFTTLLMLGAWGWLLGHFVLMIRASKAQDRTTAILAACALAAGTAGLAAGRLWLLTGSLPAARVMEAMGLWGFLVPLFVSMSYRMIPMLGGSALPGLPQWRSSWTLAALAGGSLAHGMLAAAGLAHWTWIVDAPAGLVALAVTWRWGPARGAANRLLSMLHVGYAWLAAAWLLHALQSAMAMREVHVLGLAPTHTLTVGFLSSLTVAMVSRVSRGHSGLARAADRLTWAVFLILQVAAVLRVAADIWTGAYAALLAASATLWLACFAAWCWQYLPGYWRPRADGKPG